MDIARYLDLKLTYDVLMGILETTKDRDTFMGVAKQLHEIRKEMLTIEASIPVNTGMNSNYHNYLIDEVHQMD